MADLATWFQQISAASLLAFAVVALAGLGMGVAPSSLPMFSVVVGYVAGRDETSEARNRFRGVWLTMGFVLGIASVDAVIGALFAFLGYTALRALASHLVLTNLFLFVLLVIFGLVLLRKLRVVLPVLRPLPRKANSFAAAYVLGVPFGLSTCPACTPMILPILGAAAATGVPWLGAVLLFTFGLARGVPLLFAAAVVDTVKHVHRFAPLMPKIEQAGGVLLLVGSLFFLYQAGAAAGFVPPFVTLV